MEDPLAPRMRYKVIGPRKPRELVKAHGKVGLERVEETQGKQMCQGCPRGKWDRGAYK